MTVGWVAARLSASSSIEPSMAVGTPMRRKATSSTLAKEWASGRNRNCLSSGRQQADLLDRLASYTQLAWVSITPLGLPVVPEV